MTDWTKMAKNLVVLLRVLRQLQPRYKKTLQKVMFFIELEGVEKDFADPGFEFFRYDYGPFSKELEVAVQRLHDFGLANEKGFLNERGLNFAGKVDEAFRDTPGNRELFDLIDGTVEELSEVRARELQQRSYEVELRPLDELWRNEGELKVGEIPRNITLLNPPNQVSDEAKNLNVDIEELDKLLFPFRLSSQEKEEMSEPADGSDLPLESLG